MNIPQIPALIELKSAVFQSLSGVSKINYEFEDILVNDHNIIPHLIHTLIQQASQPQFKKETDSQEQQNNQQQSESSSSISLVNQSQFLERIISNNSNISKVIKTPNALHSLCTLTCYKINIHFSQEIDKQTFKVRHSNRHCLWDIQRYGDASVQTELVNARYARVLVIAISTASGAGEEQDREICDGLDSISKFFKLLRQGRKIYLPSFPPQPLLARIFDEQIEEEGAIEEIESQMVNKGYRGDTKNNASIAKGEILNYFIEQGNQRPYWYNW
ncbi:MAG: hypothetical protein EZS28_015005 [Streblomastix strix]|uniref:Uncharacterized protein n=1 Tax=Streblomastix strix TaxID=222440 RepID=A0A5J4W429_9EUKA|nr:MAG: hypothetical protein EZS28_015005 [Streblomastix strix]